ncbi:MAG: O-antigen ligase family protein [Candidatus Omnitrophica bacterium]|nr:O-antigen ligase family protein [Candidatus Omnitrophota bacterium]
MRRENLKDLIIFIRTILELIFVLIFLYPSFYLINNYSSTLRIWIVTLLIFISFAIAKVRRLDKESLKNLFNPAILFFIVLSAAQTIKNIYTPQGLPVSMHELVHYILTVFILFYNFKDRRFLETGLVLFIVYSFRVFDLRLADNEFVFIHALTLILALIWLEGIYAKRIILPRAKPIFIPLIILIIAAILSTINAVCPYMSLAQAAVMINFIFIGFLIATSFKDIRQVNLLILTLFLIGGVLIILAVNEVLFKLLTTNIHWALNRIWIGRIGNHPPTIHVNSIAGYFSALLCLIIGSLAFYKSSIVRRTASFFIIGMLIILGLTYSRLGIFSFIFALTILLAFRHKKFINFIRKKIPFLILSAAFIIAIIALNPIKENIINRLRHTHSNNSSLYSCKITLAVIKDNPLFGVGLDNYYLLSKYAQELMATPMEGAAIATTRNLIRSAPHSLYLGIAFGLGVIGLSVFIWLLVAFIVYCLRLNNYIREDGYEKGLLQGIFVAFISIIVHGILSMTFHLTVLPAFFWIFIGWAVSMGNIKGYNEKINYELKSWKAIAALIIIILISIGIVINPILAESSYNLALNNFNSGALNQAIRKIDWAKKFVPINPKFYELSAEIQIKQGFIDAAIGSYKKALQFRRDFAFYHAKLGQLYQQKRMYAYALREFNRAIMLDKYGAYPGEHYSDLGLLYEVMGKKEEAVAQFKQAVLIDPEVVKNSAWSGLKYLEGNYTK